MPLQAKVRQSQRPEQPTSKQWLSRALDLPQLHLDAVYDSLVALPAPGPGRSASGPPNHWRTPCGIGLEHSPLRVRSRAIVLEPAVVSMLAGQQTPSSRTLWRAGPSSSPPARRSRVSSSQRLRASPPALRTSWRSDSARGASLDSAATSHSLRVESSERSNSSSQLACTTQPGRFIGRAVGRVARARGPRAHGCVVAPRPPSRRRHRRREIARRLALPPARARGSSARPRG